jgi:hypothetical protein
MVDSISFLKDILPLFTKTDIDHMKPLGVHLDDYEYMSTPEKAAAVYQQLSSKRMPPSKRGGAGPWPDEDIALFQAWIIDGYQP